ncbi:LysR family transcriptional regulator [Rhodanobacter sp. Col0626]|uniref:LysR family transcriptional regulator n=1 Tax=Rhodanobacter sp. Col0626 TaxID=3415679 RepID=UPI003CF96002
MQRNQLSDMSIFVEVARTNGFRSAAQALKLGPGSVSDAIQRFEDRLGVRLFDRTTRRIALTTAGAWLYERSLPLITDLENAVRELNDTEGMVAGTLRLTAPRSSGPFFLDALMGRFVVEYPDVDIEIIYDDRKVDLVSSGVDAAIRSQTLLEQETHAINIGPELGLVIVGSPSYLERKGTPRKPADLLDHDGIFFAFGSAERLASWNFEGPEGVYAVAPKTKVVVNDMMSMLSYAKAGAGLTYVYEEAAAPFIESGTLVRVLDGQVPNMPRYTINYLTKKHMPARLRAFIDLAKDRGK